MRYLILTDLHANRHALDAVLEAAPRGTYDQVVVLGDLVGYGADPNGVIACVRALDPIAIIRGNHDKVACGLDSPAEFNAIARAAALWTAHALTPENREYLRSLPAGPQILTDDLEICHGAPFDEDAYVFDSVDAMDAFDAARRPVCLFGHTHLPVIFTRSAHGLGVTVPPADDVTAVDLDREMRYLINPGSVGQARDGNPRAAFAILDDTARRIELRRVAYPIERAQEAILAAGLPAPLAHRLGVGR
jgi:predicted phosphodiesterase